MRPSSPTKESVKDEKKHAKAQKEIREMVRSLLADLSVHSPPLEKDGIRVSNMRAVPVGKRLAKLPAAGRDLVNAAAISYFGREREKVLYNYMEKECFIWRKSVLHACVGIRLMRLYIHFLKESCFVWYPKM